MATPTTDDLSAPHRANAQAAIDVVTAMSAGDVPRLMELWAPELRFHFARSAGMIGSDSRAVDLTDAPQPHDPVMEGRDVYLASYTGALEKIFAESDPPEFLHVVADGDLVVPLVVIRARLRDGTQYTHLYCFPMRFEDSKVVEMWEIHDTAYAFPLFRRQMLGAEA